MTSVDKGTSVSSVRSKRSHRVPRSTTSVHSFSSNAEASSSSSIRKKRPNTGARGFSSSRSSRMSGSGSSRRLLAEKVSSDLRRKRPGRHSPPGLKVKMKSKSSSTTSTTTSKPKPKTKTKTKNKTKVKAKTKIKAKGSGGLVAKGRSRDKIKDKEKDKGTARMFICPICFRIFNRQARLKKHMSTHKGVPHTAQDRVLVRQLQRILKSLDSRVTIGPLEGAASPATRSVSSTRPGSVQRVSTQTGSFRPRSLRPRSARPWSSRPGSLRPRSKRPLTCRLKHKRNTASMRKLRPVQSPRSLRTPPPLPPPASASCVRRRTQYQPFKRYICPICSQTFEWLGQLKRHLQEHRTEKMFKRYKKNLDSTGSTDDPKNFIINQDEGPYRCKICDAEFPSVRTLIRHINHVHGYPRYRKASVDSTSSGQGSSHSLRSTKS